MSCMDRTLDRFRHQRTLIFQYRFAGSGETPKEKMGTNDNKAGNQELIMRTDNCRSSSP